MTWLLNRLIDILDNRGYTVAMYYTKEEVKFNYFNGNYPDSNSNRTLTATATRQYGHVIETTLDNLEKYLLKDMLAAKILDDDDVAYLIRARLHESSNSY